MIFINIQYNYSNNPDGCEYPFLVRPFSGRTKKDTANQQELRLSKCPSLLFLIKKQYILFGFSDINKICM
jgi:hypothetical protein